MDYRDLSTTIAQATRLSPDQATNAVSVIVAAVSRACIGDEHCIELSEGRIGARLERGSLVRRLANDLGIGADEASEVLDAVVVAAAA